jgi:hypothetical protein
MKSMVVIGLEKVSDANVVKLQYYRNGGVASIR